MNIQIDTEALEAFAAKRFPREIGYKYLFKKDDKQEVRFTRNRYVDSAEKMAERLKKVKNDFFMSVYSFTEAPEEKQRWDRNKAVIDRMFFDFDCKESLTPALREAKKLVRHLQGVPIVVFSGSKGFHVHVIFKPVNVIPETIKKTGTLIVENLKLKTCDVQVFEVARLCRVPFSIHSSTNVMVTMINPHRFMKMGTADVIRFAKRQEWDFPEYELDEDFEELINMVDVQVYEEIAEKKRRMMNQEIEVFEKQKDGSLKITTKSIAGRKKRIEFYVSTLKKYGRLGANPKIREIHSRSEWVARQGNNPGSIEHIARVHLILMMLEEGWTREMIHQAFKHAEDYNPDRVDYYIQYNMRRLAEQKAMERRQP